MSLDVIRPERPQDAAAVARVNDLAFGGGDESALVERLREAGLVAVSLVAALDEEIIGHVLLSDLHVVMDGREVSAVALAPLAVTPARQRSGVGSRLARAAIEAARAAGREAIIVLGHPHFYARFGFSAAAAAKLDAPFSGPAFMALELAPGALDGERGEVRYPAAFGLGA